MKKYYLMAIDNGNTTAMNNLGFYYKNIQKDYELMKKYYLMAIDNGNTTAMNNLGFYYKNIQKDYELMKKYYLMSIKKGNSNAMTNLDLYYKNNKLEFYRELLKIENKNDLILNEINKLEKTKEIQIYKNKIRLFSQLNNYKKCILCLEENVLNIILSCGHEICINCYNTNFNCVYNYCNCL
jgi:TPR repeat protein